MLVRPCRRTCSASAAVRTPSESAFFAAFDRRLRKSTCLVPAIGAPDACGVGVWPYSQRSASVLLVRSLCSSVGV